MKQVIGELCTKCTRSSGKVTTQSKDNDDIFLPVFKSPNFVVFEY